MVAFGIDTTVTIRLITGEPPEQAAQARAILAEQSVTLSDLVVAETFHVLRHHFAVPHADAIATLRMLVLDRQIVCTGLARAVLLSPSAQGTNPGFVDRLIHAGYERDGSAFLTFDRAAGRLPGATVLR